MNRHDKTRLGVCEVTELDRACMSSKLRLCGCFVLYQYGMLSALLVEERRFDSSFYICLHSTLVG